MSTTQSQINNQLFGRLNSLESKVDGTNGIPVRLANARLRAAENKQTTNVATVTLSPAP